MTSKTAASTPDAPALAKPTRDEMVDSLTGFEELAIEKRFDAEVFELSFLKRLRALVMIILIREGQAAPEAQKSVMGMTQAQVVEHFADEEEDDPETDFPVTESGKDDSAPE